MTAVSLVLQAIVDALNAHAGLTSIIGVNRVFAGAAAPATLMPYVVIGSMSESTRGMFAGEMFDDAWDVHVFVAGFNSAPALQIYNQIKSAWNTPVVVSGFADCRIKLELVMILPETERNTSLIHLHARATCLAI